MRSRLLAFLVLMALLPFLTGATIVIRGPRVSAAAAPSYVYAPGWDSGASGGSTWNLDPDLAGLAKVTFPSAGTVTKLGIYIMFVNTGRPVKMAIFDSSRNAVGSAITNTISSGDGQWHEWTTSISIPSSGTYYIGMSYDGSGGDLVSKYRVETSGDGYWDYTSGNYAAFPTITWGSSNSNSIALRAEFTP